MNEINRTLYIPLYGKALVSRKGLFLKDETAQRLWEEVAFPLRGKAKSKWLAYFLGIRAAVFDGWLREQLQAHPDATVLHLGCGLDSRIHRVGNGDHRWYDDIEHDMTPKRFVDELRGFERRLFSTLYGGRFAKTLYRMYEYSA